MDIVRKELNSIAVEWNQNIISRSVNDGPSGRPDTMYFCHICMMQRTT